jgi:hypothetical protein
MGAPEIEAFLSHLAQEGNVSASTQNQAFNLPWRANIPTPTKN